MYLADTNVWLALTIAGHDFRTAAKAWLAGLGTDESVAFCRATQISFLRLLTTAAVFVPYNGRPLKNKAAWLVCQQILGDRRVELVAEPAHTERHWQRLAAKKQSSPKLWMDAYLAAFAIAGDYHVVTTDAAFKQFKGLQVIVLSKS